MNNPYSNVIVQLNRRVTPEEIRQVEGSLNGTTGIHRARVSPKVRNLVLVDYDARHTNSRTILETVRREVRHGNLIGM